MDNPTLPGISVVICSYNGASRLPQTLRHLALQVVPAAINWEVIVIDNASTDDTSTVARTQWLQYNLPGVGFTILKETRPGKYHALSTGVENAKYEFIIICDDDNWLTTNYVNQSYHTISSNAQFAAVGGQGIAVADQEIPDWFWQHQHRYAVGAPKARSGDVSTKGYLWGAGMVVRKSLYRKVYSSSAAILRGPTETVEERAEDVELCMRFLLAGYRLYYDEELVFRHHLSVNRLTESYRDRLSNISKYEDRVLNLYRKQIDINQRTTIKKYFLLCTSLFRYVICKIFPRLERWHSAYEAEVIYLLSGHKAAPVSDEVCKIRKLNLNLAKKNFA